MMTKTKQSEIKRIFRSKEDKMIAGVCGGIAEYFEVDSVWIRLAAVFLVFASGVGLVLYIIAWIIMPENPNQKDKTKTISEKIVSDSQKKIKKKHNHREGAMLGTLLIIIGSYFFLKRLFPVFDMDNIWPFILIFFGIYLLSRGKNHERKNKHK